jgi:hypothetical protein
MSVRIESGERTHQHERTGQSARIAEVGSLATLTYQSNAVRSFSEGEIHTLLHDAQTRNRSLGITGLLVYDQDRFFQCLEGPADSIDHVWRSIRRDDRHSHVELLGNSPTQSRFFADWDMKLAQPGRPSTEPSGESMYVAPAVVELLYRTPRAAPTILAMLAPSRTVGEVKQPDLLETDRSALTEIVRRVAVPQLAIVHGLTPPAHVTTNANVREITHLSQLSQLPRLLIAAEPSRAFKIIADAYAESHSLGDLCASLLEPAARTLGDLWHSDDCSELDVTLGLCRIQTALRRIDFASSGPSTHVANPHSALLATLPGETHMLGSTTNAEMLWQAGWDTRVEFPATDEALQSLVSDAWFDSLDLSMSPAFSREDWRERLKTTVAAARRASRNPSLAITISGRLAFENADTAQRVGADNASKTAMQIESVMLEALRHGAGDD